MPRKASKRSTKSKTEFWKTRPVEADGDVSQADVLKVDDSLGLVFGWGIVCNQFGKAYFDTQGDHIPESSMLEAATDFMLNSRVSGDMHVKADGSVVFAFPLTTDIAKAFGIESDVTGLMIAIKPSDEVLAKFKSGDYTGFSIGGKYIDNETVEAD